MLFRVAVPIALLAVMAAGCGGDETPAARPTPGASGLIESVTIAGFAFEPASLTVFEGTAVTWTNTDDAAHTVTIGEPGSTPGPIVLFDSAVDPNGSSFTFVFTTEGTYKYYCRFHPDRMRAEVKVAV